MHEGRESAPVVPAPADQRRVFYESLVGGAIRGTFQLGRLVDFGSMGAVFNARHKSDSEEKYAVNGSFLDVDVVGSYGMKHASNRPEHIIVSFERWRSWVSDIVEEFTGMVLNSNGDELMCFFDSTPQAVRAALAHKVTDPLT